MENQTEETTDIQGATTYMNPANSPRLIVRRSRSQRSRPAPNSLLGVQQQHRAAILGIHWLIANGTTASSCLLAASLLAHLFLPPQPGRSQEQEMAFGTMAVIGGLFLLAKVQEKVLLGGGLAAIGWTYCLFLSLVYGIAASLFALAPLFLLDLKGPNNELATSVWALCWFGIGAGFCQAIWLELKWADLMVWTIASTLAFAAAWLAGIFVFDDRYDLSLGKSTMTIMLAGLSYGAITGPALVYISGRTWSPQNVAEDRPEPS